MAFAPRLAPVPSSPNCVSSLAEPTDRVHAIAPLAVPGPDAIARIQAVLEAMPRVAIVVTEPDYLHAVCTSAVFRFKDDLELQADPDAGVVHVRCAARLGYGDFGVNRKRVEALRRALAAG